MLSPSDTACSQISRTCDTTIVAIHISTNKRKEVMSKIISTTVFESSFKHRVEMARTKVKGTKDIILFMIVDGIEKGTVTLLGYAIVTEETSSNGDSEAIFTKGKSICEYFDNAKLRDVFTKYEKLAKVGIPQTILHAV